ncbi:MAG: hypothetical protein Q9183_008080 [Haloplaca sp. 2 TL-2023]
MVQHLEAEEPVSGAEDPDQSEKARYWRNQRNLMAVPTKTLTYEEACEALGLDPKNPTLPGTQGVTLKE